MERELLGELKKWKNRKRRKPLIIKGARQVGKTWIMKEFGRLFFENVAYVNCDNNENVRNVFEMDYQISRIISALQVETHQRIEPDKTLIIFDEIQETPKALSCLKYFCEEAPEYAIVAAGSLLGIALHAGTSFPVGKVDFMELHPMSFTEFLRAVGESGLAELLQGKDYELVNGFAPKFTDLLRTYYYVGGMPEVVGEYVESRDFFEVRRLQRQILDYYMEDFSKHAPAKEVPRIHMVWNSIPAQLAKENRKFLYGSLREGARAKEFEIAIQWLEDCGLIHRSYRVKKPGIPLTAYMDMTAFKMYMLDVGLLTAKSELEPEILLQGNKLFTEFKGALTEQFVAQELCALDRSLYYFAREKSDGEIDFLLQKGMEVIPLEVKAEENLQAKSLKAYCAEYQPQTAIRTSLSGYREQDWMKNVPLYLLREIL